MGRAFFIFIFAALFGAGPLPHPAGAAEEARETIAEWVEAQRILSDEQSTWRSQRAGLRQSIQLLEEEVEQLDKRIRELQAASGEAEEERERLSARSEDLQESTGESEKFVDQLEDELRALRSFFPPVLETRVAPLFDRFDSGSGENGPSLSQRVQAVLALLGEVNDFQRQVTLSRETREFDGGVRREVHTIYLGFGHAYFVDDDRRVAGVGKPDSDGWHWQRNDELAGAVGRTVAILEGNRPAEFIDLPVNVSADR